MKREELLNEILEEIGDMKNCLDIYNLDKDLKIEEIKEMKFFNLLLNTYKITLNNIEYWENSFNPMKRFLKTISELEASLKIGDNQETLNNRLNSYLELIKIENLLKVEKEIISSDNYKIKSVVESFKDTMDDKGSASEYPIIICIIDMNSTVEYMKLAINSYVKYKDFDLLGILREYLLYNEPVFYSNAIGIRKKMYNESIIEAMNNIYNESVKDEPKDEVFKMNIDKLDKVVNNYLNSLLTYYRNEVSMIPESVLESEEFKTVMNTLK